MYLKIMTPDERIVSNIYKHSGPESERKEAIEESEQILKVIKYYWILITQTF